ncbi:MAG: hypothetical protein AMXMBFR48_22660 [Ignavibacteriales bacterium]
MKTIYYQLILDRSGSMESVREQTVSSFNEQVSAIQQLVKEFPDQPVSVSLTLFNDRIDIPLQEESPARIKPFTRKDYEPNGTTSLLDAIGMSVTRLQTKIADQLKNGEAEVIVVILTDGHENSSRNFNLAQIAGLIRELEATGNWKFSYLGATLDAIDVAAQMNIDAKYSVRFQKEHTGRTMSKISDSVASYMRKREDDKNAKWEMEDDE